MSWQAASNHPIVGRMESHLLVATDPCHNRDLPYHHAFLATTSVLSFVCNERRDCQMDHLTPIANAVQAITRLPYLGNTSAYEFDDLA